MVADHLSFAWASERSGIDARISMLGWRHARAARLPTPAAGRRNLMSPKATNLAPIEAAAGHRFSLTFSRYPDGRPAKIILSSRHIGSPTGAIHGALTRYHDGAPATLLSEAQEAFQLWCVRNGVPHSVAYTLDEALAVLAAWGCLRIKNGGAR